MRHRVHEQMKNRCRLRHDCLEEKDTSRYFFNNQDKNTAKDTILYF